MSSSFKLLNHEDGDNKNKFNYINNGNQNNNFTPKNKLGLLDDILGSNNSNSEINDLITDNIGIYNKINNTSNVVTEKKEKNVNTLNMNSYNLNLNNTNSDGKLFGINDIISNDNNKINIFNNNSEFVEKQNNEENIKTENAMKDKEIPFKPKDIQGTANLNQEEGINKVNEFKLEENNNKNVTEIETKVNSDKMPENLEIIENKIQSNDICLNMLQNQIIDNSKNMNNISTINLNNINIDKEEKNEINDENKKDGNLNESLDNKKEEVEEVKKEENNNNIFTEEQKEVKDDSNVNPTMLKDIIKQNKKQLLDNLNSNVNKEDKIDIKNNINDDIINNNNIKKDEQKEIKNDSININFNINNFEQQKEIKDSNIFINNIEEKNKNNNNNSKKYGEKIKEKKKQLTNTVFNRLYNDGKKAKDNEKEKEKEKENNLKKNGKTNKVAKNKKNKESNKNVNSSNDSNLFSSNLLIQNFLKESKNSEILKKLEILKQPLLFVDYEDEEYSFKPEINKKSRDLVKKRLQKKKNNSPLNKTDINNNSKKDNKNTKKNGSQIIVNKSSISMLLKKNEHNINEIIEKYSNNNDGKLSIVNTIQCLWDIHILREILKSNSKNIETIDLETIKNIVKEIGNKNAKNTREIEEIEFVEQLWIKVNPYYKNENDFIDKEILHKFLKILFSLDEQSEINKMITTVENFLKPINQKKKAQIEVNNLKEYIKEKDKDKNKEEIKEDNIDQDNKDINNENNINENNDITNNKISSNKSLNMKDYNNYKYISLLREKKFEKNEIWPVSKFLRAFFELKKLIYTYKNTKKDKIMEEIIKERDKDLTFQPNFNATTSYFKRKSINDKKEDIQNNSLNNSSISGVNSNKNKKKRDFNKMYEEFMLKKKMHEQALMILRQNKDKKEIKMCTDRPKINKHYKIKNRKKTPEVGCSRNEFLYKLNKEIQDTRKQKILERQKEIEEKETFSFMPTINKNLKKNYAEHPKRMPRGSEQYIKRNRSVIQFKKRQFNYQLNTDSNYEKEEHQKTNLHILKDTEKKNNVNNVNNINNINNINKKEIEQKELKEYKEQKDNIEKTDDKNNNQKDDVYFTIQVKTAEGYVKPLKLYINKNPIETANNFCDINNIRKSTRDKIILNIKKLQKQYGE